MCSLGKIKTDKVRSNLISTENIEVSFARKPDVSDALF